MPSKGKKPARTSAAGSAAGHAASPISRSSSQDQDSSDVVESLRRRILSAAAAAEYPALIADASFLGTISEVEPSNSKSNHARVWLSEAAMVSSALRPGSLVAVSLVSSVNNPSDGLPLGSLVEDCGRQLGLENVGENEPGRYFAIAMVFTSRKVFKNGVRLSWGVSCTMGFPSLGRLAFICPLTLSHQPADELDGSTNLLTVHACNDLYLEFIPMKFRSSFVASSDPVSSPVGKGSPSKSSLSSGRNDFVQNADPSLFLDVSAAKLALADEKVKELLQIYASRWLHGRHFLKGNVVVITVLGQHCIFLVEGVEFALGEPDSTSAKDRSFSQEIKIPINSGQRLDIFVVDARTKVHFSGSNFLDGVESNKIGLPVGHVSYGHIIDEQAGDIPRLGGLSKEFAALKEIILHSSVKSDNALRRFWFST